MLRRLGLEVEQRPGHLEYLLTHQAAKLCRSSTRAFKPSTVGR